MARKLKCVCGYHARYWANLLAHRRTCESWKEHTAQLEGKGVVPAPQQDADLPIVMYGCPYCDSSYEVSDFEKLKAHVESCRVKRWQEQTVGEGEIRIMLRKIRAWLAWEVWQDEEEHRGLDD